MEGLGTTAGSDAGAVAATPSDGEVRAQLSLILRRLEAIHPPDHPRKITLVKLMGRVI